MTRFLILISLVSISTVVATNQTSMNQDITIATQEMQKANYFTFVMLINMAPSDLIQGGITFLMPNDRILSKTEMSESSVVDFLLRHSIPSPLLMDHLEHFPTGSMIPTSKPDFMFKVTNDGRRRFFLSNVRIISPNICTQGNNIRCHGIDGVVQPESTLPQPILPQPSASTCGNGSGTPAAAVSPVPPPPEAAGGGFVDTVAAPPLVVRVGPPKSGGSPKKLVHGWLIELVIACLWWSSYGFR